MAAYCDDQFKSNRCGIKSSVVYKVRERLSLGYLRANNKSMKNDRNWRKQCGNTKKTQGITVDDLITPRLVSSLNVPMADRIKSIIFNMERCRWISSISIRQRSLFLSTSKHIEMNYVKEAKTLLNSKVVVGKVMNQTGDF